MHFQAGTAVIVQRVGRRLFAAVAVFGVATIALGVTRTFVVALVLSLAGPRTPSRAVPAWQVGARLVFVLDQSASMFAPWDPGGDRTKLQAAKEAIRALVQRRRDQVALIGFGRSSIVYTPLTFDRGRLLGLLRLQDRDLGDTIIDEALLRALDLLEADPVPAQAVVLLSDGAGRMRDPEGVAERFRASGTRMYWIQIGGPPDPAMEALLVALGSLGRRFVVGAGDELPQMLHEFGELGRAPIRVLLRTAEREWDLPARWIAAVCLAVLAVFAIAESTRRDRRAP